MHTLETAVLRTTRFPSSLSTLSHDSFLAEDGVLDAIESASPNLTQQLRTSRSAGSNEALANYQYRMTTRCTPYPGIASAKTFVPGRTQELLAAASIAIRLGHDIEDRRFANAAKWMTSSGYQTLSLLDFTARSPVSLRSGAPQMANCVSRRTAFLDSLSGVAKRTQQTTLTLTQQQISELTTLGSQGRALSPAMDFYLALAARPSPIRVIAAGAPGVQVNRHADTQLRRDHALAILQAHRALGYDPRFLVDPHAANRIPSGGELAAPSALPEDTMRCDHSQLQNVTVVATPGSRPYLRLYQGASPAPLVFIPTDSLNPGLMCRECATALAISRNQFRSHPVFSFGAARSFLPGIVAKGVSLAQPTWIPPHHVYTSADDLSAWMTDHMVPETFAFTPTGSDGGAPGSLSNIEALVTAHRKYGTTLTLTPRPTTDVLTARIDAAGEPHPAEVVITVASSTTAAPGPPATRLHTSTPSGHPHDVVSVTCDSHETAHSILGRLYSLPAANATWSISQSGISINTAFASAEHDCIRNYLTRNPDDRSGISITFSQTRDPIESRVVESDIYAYRSISQRADILTMSLLHTLARLSARARHLYTPLLMSSTPANRPCLSALASSLAPEDDPLIALPTPSSPVEAARCLQQVLRRYHQWNLSRSLPWIEFSKTAYAFARTTIHKRGQHAA